MAAHWPGSWASILRTKPLRTRIRRHVNSNNILRYLKHFPYVNLPYMRLYGQPACIVTQRAGDALRKAAPSERPTTGCTPLQHPRSSRNVLGIMRMTVSARIAQAWHTWNEAAEGSAGSVAAVPRLSRPAPDIYGVSWSDTAEKTPESRIWVESGVRPGIRHGHRTLCLSPSSASHDHCSYRIVERLVRHPATCPCR